MAVHFFVDSRAPGLKRQLKATGADAPSDDPELHGNDDDDDDDDDHDNSPPYRADQDEVRVTYELVDRDASIFDFDLYVMPQHRLGLGFLGVWYSVNEILVPRGVRYTFSRLTRFNVASRRAHAHLGWKRVGRGVFLRAWQAEFMLATVAPFVGATFGSSQRVTLKLSPKVLTGADSQPERPWRPHDERNHRHTG